MCMKHNLIIRFRIYHFYSSPSGRFRFEKQLNSKNTLRFSHAYRVVIATYLRIHILKLCLNYVILIIFLIIMFLYII